MCSLVFIGKYRDFWEKGKNRVYRDFSEKGKIDYPWEKKLWIVTWVPLFDEIFDVIHNKSHSLRKKLSRVTLD